MSEGREGKNISSPDEGTNEESWFDLDSTDELGTLFARVLCVCVVQLACLHALFVACIFAPIHHGMAKHFGEFEGPTTFHCA